MRPRNTSVPFFRPNQKEGSARLGAVQLDSGFGKGAEHPTPISDIGIYPREQDGHPINATGYLELSYDQIRARCHMELTLLLVSVFRLFRCGSS
ncbi:MAG: hypothetical protein HY694_07225 [Deltaproteobacteria bacterium]|nr:hypothetical protein [Deltaproteobacteria bacterium]